MIGRLSGRLVAKNPPQVLVDVAGVGYEVDVPMSTFYSLPATGDPVTLHTHLVDLAQSIALQDAGRLTRIPGIGKKTAERLLLELKGKLAEVSAPAQERPSDVVNALLALGHSEKEAHSAIKGLAPGVPVAEGIRTALKALAK